MTGAAPATSMATERLACARCIGDARLRAEARASGFDAECTYCGRAGTCVDVAWLADRIHPAFQASFAPADAAAAAALDGAAATAAVAGLDDPLALDVHRTLVALFHDADGEPTYPASQSYVKRPAQGLPLLHRWADYAATLRDAPPGTDDAPLDALKWAFASLDAVATPKGRPALRTLDAGTRVFAARLEATADERLVATAGPLHAAGTPARPLALRERTAITESLAPRGARLVVARLRLARPLRVLDLETTCEALARASALDPEQATAHARARFLEGFAQALQDAAGASPDVAAWRATQRVGDWLAHGAAPRVDALLSRSAHARGRVLTLFAPACTTGAVVVERERLYAVGALRAKYRRAGRADPRPLRPRTPPPRG